MGNHHLCEFNGHAVECVNSHEFANANTKIGGLAAHLCVIHIVMTPSKKRHPRIHTGNPRLHTGTPRLHMGILPKKKNGDSLFAKGFHLNMVINIP
jgi:hypothetical protein